MPKRAGSLHLSASVSPAARCPAAAAAAAAVQEPFFQTMPGGKQYVLPHQVSGTCSLQGEPYELGGGRGERQHFESRLHAAGCRGWDLAQVRVCVCVCVCVPGCMHARMHPGAM